MKNTFRTSLLFLSLAVFAAGSAFAPQQQPTPAAAEPEVRITQVDTARFPLVTVYISATDARGEPVGIDSRQLVIEENNQPIQMDQIQARGVVARLTTMLVIDISGSMDAGGKLKAAKAVAKEYIRRMRPDDRAGLISFDTQVSVVQPVTADREVLNRAVDSLAVRGDTAMYDALIAAVRQLEAVEGRKAVIALTDGVDNRSKNSAEQVIQGIGTSGVSISTIGLGDPSRNVESLSAVNETVLKTLAKNAGGRYGFAEDENTLKALYDLYGRSLQSEYAVTYTSPAQLRDGVSRSLRVRLAPAQNQAGGTTGGTTAAADARYNPGGLVPEVAAGGTWLLFFGLLLGLLVLLALPALWKRFHQPAAAAEPKINLNPAAPDKKRPHIKLL